jgi:hypothetical protein
MTTEGSSIHVTVYVWGDALAPAEISSILGVHPSLARRKGETRLIRTKQTITCQTGVWALDIKVNSTELSAHIAEVESLIGNRACRLPEAFGVEGAYLDIYVALTLMESNGGKFSLRLAEEDVHALHRIGLPLELSIDIVSDRDT